jgi:thymidylate kinase
MRRESTRASFFRMRREPLNDTRPTRIVTFSGLDGSGKSSQALMLLERLRAREIEAVIEWVPIAINPSIDYAKRAVNTAAGLINLSRANRRPTAAPDGRPPLPASKRLVRRFVLIRHGWSTVVTLANVVSHWRVYLRYREHATIVIFDRYALDTAVRLDTWYGNLGSTRFQAWLVRVLSPRSLRSYLLDIPAEIAYARKPEQFSVDVLSRQADVYRREYERFDVQWMDGQRTPKEIAVEVEADVCRGLGLTTE